jgi:hypothetical protein
MLTHLKTLSIVFILTMSFTATAAPLYAADQDPLMDVLKKVDDLVCTTPKKIADLYDPEMVIMSDDKRVLLKNRVSDYQMMIADLEEMKCKFTRTFLAGNVGEKVGFLLVDEMISVSSRVSTDDRQHAVCTYGFKKENNTWIISHEHCSSLPDYSIVPGDDALYYFHNPVY